MAKRAALIAVGVTLLVFLLPIAALWLAGDGDGPMTPPAGELLVAGLSVVIVFTVAFAIAYAIQRRKARQTRLNR